MGDNQLNSEYYPTFSEIADRHSSSKIHFVLSDSKIHNSVYKSLPLDLNLTLYSFKI